MTIAGKIIDGHPNTWLLVLGGLAILVGVLLLFE
jgi:hypothetical protein